MHISRSMAGLVVVAAMLGCNASNDHSLEGQWQPSGALVSGYVLQITQTGQSVSGQLYTDSGGVPGRTFTGTNANGSVTLLFGVTVCVINGTHIVGNCPPTGTFTGHFHGANTVEGLASGQSLTLTRLPSDSVPPN